MALVKVAFLELGGYINIDTRNKLAEKVLLLRLTDFN